MTERESARLRARRGRCTRQGYKDVLDTAVRAVVERLEGRVLLSTVLYRDDFERAAPGAPNATWSSGAFEQTPVFAREQFLGTFDAGRSDVALTLRELTPGVPHTVAFHLFVIGGWNGVPGNVGNRVDGDGNGIDGDSGGAPGGAFELSADGERVLSAAFNNVALDGARAYWTSGRPGVYRPQLGADRAWRSLGFEKGGTEDAVYRIEQEFVPQGRTATLRFAGRGLAAGSGQAFGLDNVVVIEGRRAALPAGRHRAGWWKAAAPALQRSIPDGQAGRPSFHAYTRNPELQAGDYDGFKQNLQSGDINHSLMAVLEQPGANATGHELSMWRGSRNGVDTLPLYDAYGNVLEPPEPRHEFVGTYTYGSLDGAQGQVLYDLPDLPNWATYDLTLKALGTEEDGSLDSVTDGHVASTSLVAGVAHDLVATYETDATSYGYTGAAVVLEWKYGGADENGVLQHIDLNPDSNTDPTSFTIDLFHSTPEGIPAAIYGGIAGQTTPIWLDGQTYYAVIPMDTEPFTSINNENGSAVLQFRVRGWGMIELGSEHLATLGYDPSSHTGGATFYSHSTESELAGVRVYDPAVVNPLDPAGPANGLIANAVAEDPVLGIPASPGEFLLQVSPWGDLSGAFGQPFLRQDGPGAEGMLLLDRGQFGGFHSRTNLNVFDGLADQWSIPGVITASGDENGEVASVPPDGEFYATPTSAVSTVRANGWEVTHAFSVVPDHPDLFAVDVSITPGANVSDLVYSRSFGFDATYGTSSLSEPEWLSFGNAGGAARALIGGVEVAPDERSEPGPMDGPLEFERSFGEVGEGETVTFRLYYGVSPSGEALVRSVENQGLNAYALMTTYDDTTFSPGPIAAIVAMETAFTPEPQSVDWGDQIGPTSNHRVDIHGVPLPDPSPTGEGEGDRVPNTASIDMFTLTPTFDTTDVAVPMPGGDLLMEFRRSLGVDSVITQDAQVLVSAPNANFRWEVEDLLGRGWNTNLGSRVILNVNPYPDEGDPTTVATVYDEAGVPAQYWGVGGGVYRPFVRQSFANTSLRADLDTNVVYDDTTYAFALTKAHGTRLFFSQAGSVTRGTLDKPEGETYYRLDRVVDRNGNEIRMHYGSGNARLVTAMYDPSLGGAPGSANPSDRRIEFGYTNTAGGVRLAWVKDPLAAADTNRAALEYTYGGGSRLESVVRPPVRDGDSPGTVRAAVHFTYRTRTVQRIVVKSVADSYDSHEWITFTLPETISNAYADPNDPRKHVTTFAWGPDPLNPVALPSTPTAITSRSGQPVLLWEAKPRLYKVTTDDGEVVFGQTSRTHTTATTTVTDTRGSTTTYQFGSGTSGQIVPAANSLGFAIVIDRVVRSVPVTDADGNTSTKTVTFEYSSNINRNLLAVTDVSGNRVEFEYGDGRTPATDPYSDTPYGAYFGSYYAIFNKPSASILAAGGLDVTTSYKYRTQDNLLEEQTDAEGTVTRYGFDAKGNRTSVTEGYATAVAATTTYEYDDDPATPAVYDPTGFVVKAADPDGRVTEYLKNEFGNIEYTIVKGFAAANEDLTPLATTSPFGTAIDPDGRWLVTRRLADVMDRTLFEHDGRGNVTGYEYDGWNRVTAVTPPAVAPATWDPLSGAPPSLTTGATLSFYDLNSNLVKRVDQNQNVTTYAYDTLNRLTETRVKDVYSTGATADARDIVTRRTYDEVGLVETETDALNRVTQYEYDALLRPIRTTLPTVTEVTTPSSTSASPGTHTAQYTTKTYYGPNAGSGAFTLGGFNPTRVVDARGYATDTKYDDAYRAVQVVRRSATGAALAALPSTAAPAAGEPATLTQYNKVHQPIAVTVLNDDRDGYSTDRTSYTFYDHRHRATVGLLDFDGDGAGAAAGTVVDDPAAFGGDADDFVTRTAYDGAGNATAVTNALGHTTQTEFDGAGRPTLVTSPAVDVFIPGTGLVAGVSPTSRTVYDASSNPVRTIDSNGHVTETLFDERDRAVRTILDLNGDGTFNPATNSADIVRWTGFDLNGNAVYAIDPKGNRTDTTFDKANRPIEVEGPEVPDAEDGGQMTRPLTLSDYDKNGNVVRVTDPRGVAVETTYDEWNRARLVTANADAAATAADRLVTETRYDPNGNALALVLHNRVNGSHRAQVTTYAYDAFDRRTTETLPDVGDNQARVTTTAYSRAGDALTVVDPKGQTVETDYDRAGRVGEQRFLNQWGSPEETRTSGYDAAGNLLARTDLHGASTYTYDALSRLATESRETTTNGIEDAYTVYSDYDKAGNRTRLVYPDQSGAGTGRTLVSHYDRAGRIAQVDDGTRVTTFGYDHAGNRTSHLAPNGVLTGATFDALNRVESMNSTKDAGAGDPVYGVYYGYDLAGNRRFATEELTGLDNRELTWDYDALYRLTGETWTGPAAQTRTYAYDPAGNRLTRSVDDGSTTTTTTSTYDDLNRLRTATTGTNVTTFAYDLNGNRTLAQGAGGPDRAYVFDTSDRLIEVDVGGDPVFFAQYDARTRRLAKSGTAGPVTVFRYDGGTNFQELQDQNIVTELVRAGGLGGGIGSVLYTDKSLDQNGGPVEHFVYNAVGSTVALTDESGSITQTSLYEAFGDTVTKTGTSSNNRLHNTKERDASIGLDNHGFRYYDPETATYIQRDPIGYGDGLNVYTSVHDNPINGIDPLGLSDEWPWGESWWDYTGVGTIVHAWYDVAINPTANLAAGWAQTAAEAKYNGDLYDRVLTKARTGKNYDGEARQLGITVSNFREGAGRIAENAPGTLAAGPIVIGGTSKAVRAVGAKAELALAGRTATTVEQRGAAAARRLAGTVDDAVEAAEGTVFRAGGRLPEGFDNRFVLSTHSANRPRPVNAVGNIFESHHGVWDAWAEANIKGYDGKNAPTLLMAKPNHNATRTVFVEFAKSAPKLTNGGVDWKNIPESEARKWSEKMFDASGVPNEARAAYYRDFDNMKSSAGER